MRQGTLAFRRVIPSWPRRMRSCMAMMCSPGLRPGKRNSVPLFVVVMFHRSDVKVPEYPKQMLRFKSDDDRAAFVLAANLFRRHLTREQRAQVVTRLRAKGWSLRRIGEAVGVEEITVRRDLEIGSDIPSQPERSLKALTGRPTRLGARAPPSSSALPVMQPAPLRRSRRSATMPPG